MAYPWRVPGVLTATRGVSLIGMSLLGRWCGLAGLALAGVLALGQGAGQVAAQGVGTGLSQPAPPQPGSSQSGTPQTTVLMPPVPLLPHSALLLDAPAGLVPADSAEAQAVLKEDGLKRVETRGLAGAPDAWVEAYQFDDATGAFAAYTYLRLGGKPLGGADVPKTAVRTPDSEIVFMGGTSVVRVHLQASAGLNTLLAAVQTGLPKVGGRKGLAPLLPALLPAAGLDASSIRYALGPVGYQALGGLLPRQHVGWDKSVEVATAAYDLGRGQLTLLLYPTPQLASERGRALQDDLNAPGTDTLGLVKMRRVGPLLGVASGRLTAARAEDLVQRLKLNEEITFDKPMPLEFHAEVRKTYSLLQSISVFVGLMILAALVLAVFLGGARAGVRLLQGKPAASEAEFLTINLRGESKELSKPGSTPKPKD